MYTQGKGYLVNLLYDYDIIFRYNNVPKSKNLDHLCDCRSKFVISNMNVTKEKTRVDVQSLHFLVNALEIWQNVIGKKSNFKIISTGIHTKVKITIMIGK